MNAPMKNARAVGAATGADEAGLNASDSSTAQNLSRNGMLPVNPDAIPDELTVMRSAVWRSVPRGEGKIGKPPCHPTTGRMIGANQPEQWGTFSQAASAYTQGGWDGIGVLMEARHGIVGIDIDNWRDTVSQNPRLQRILKMALDSGVYCEHSPSGNGLRLFVRGHLPGNKGRRKGCVEAYSHERFLTVTGQGKGSIAEGQWLIDELLRIIGDSPSASPTIAAASDVPANPMIVAMLAKRIAEQHPRLWEGRWAQKDGDLDCAPIYPSQSEADMAMAGHLVREAIRLGVAQGELAVPVMEAFKQSGLYRPEKHQQMEKYTITKAITSATAPVVIADSGMTYGDEPEGDIKAARLFAQAYRGKLLYATAKGTWIHWAGSRWEWSTVGEEMAAAKDVAGKIMAIAAKLYAQDPDQHKRKLAFAMRLQNLPRLEAMLQVAKSEPDMSLGSVTELDANRMLLGVRNGVIDLKTGARLTPSPDMLITRQAAASYGPDAQCPHWIAFLDSIFDGDKETIAFIRRALGYTLTGSTGEEVMFICYGHGANGKSVFANVVYQIMGDYAQTAPPSLLTLRRDGDNSPRNDIASLCGARKVSINELSQGDRLDEQIVKMLAGRESLSARFLHREFFEFWPMCKAWLRTNHRPIITGEDEGIWRRIMLIPFKRKFAEHERDIHLEERLLAERDGILAWMVEGCLDWQRTGLKPSPLVQRKSRQYRKESDLLGEFLDDETVPMPDERINQQTLFNSWRLWNENNGTRAGSKASFTRKLSERNYTEGKSNGKRYYAGLALRQSVQLEVVTHDQRPCPDSPEWAAADASRRGANPTN